MKVPYHLLARSAASYALTTLIAEMPSTRPDIMYKTSVPIKQKDSPKKDRDELDEYAYLLLSRRQKLIIHVPTTGFC